ncbi:MAG: acetamidase/formamidase family protein [Candidatus Dormiibacterota bacterium]
MTVHELLPGRRTLHGHFSPDLEPVLRVEPGDTIRACTLLASWDDAGFDRDPRLDTGHALLGPVFVEGSEPGDSLSIEILELHPALSGRTAAGGVSSPVNDYLGLTGGERRITDWGIDHDAGVARTMEFEVDLQPFLGVIGMPPAEPGIHSTIPPRPSGGNIDCRELVAGSTLILPVAVRGGLLSFGDGHAAQGDGEVSGTAIECAMDTVELKVGLTKEAHLKGPEAHTPAGFMTFGFSGSLTDAMLIALEAMISRLQSHLGLDRAHAAALASVAVDLRVTQVVNQAMGVHALLPADRLRRNGEAVVLR